MVAVALASEIPRMPSAMVQPAAQGLSAAVATHPIRYQRRHAVRFLCIAKSDEQTEAGAPPDEALFATMGAFVEEQMNAGVLLATDGLHPSSKAARVHLADGKLTVTDGPFAEAKEVIASYALIQVNSK